MREQLSRHLLMKMLTSCNIAIVPQSVGMVHSCLSLKKINDNDTKSSGLRELTCHRYFCTIQGVYEISVIFRSKLGGIFDI